MSFELNNTKINGTDPYFYSEISGVECQTMDVFCDGAQQESELNHWQCETENDKGTSANSLDECHV